MTKLPLSRLTAALVVVAASALGSGVMAGLPPAETLAQLSDRAHEATRAAKTSAGLGEVIKTANMVGDAPQMGTLREALASLERHEAKREKDRAERAAKLEGELVEALKGEHTPQALSKALKAAVEMHMISTDKGEFLRSPRIKDLVREAEVAARSAEASADWIMANELFVRLNLLMEEDGRFKNDARRILDRLSQIRLYAPQRLWEMRNQRRLLDGQKPLPPYNSLGDDFQAKLKGVDAQTVKAALVRAADGHVERRPLRELLIGGLESVRTLVTTPDLKVAFPGVENAEAVTQFVQWIDGRLVALRGSKADPDLFQLDALVTDLLGASRQTVKVPDQAVLHEMGNGSFDRLDEFSAIVWPDELSRFRRVMDGEFIGVGVQIQLDEETQMIKVVSPLEGTPAFRAGIKAGDLIKKIDDATAVGMTLDQAVDLITGSRGTRVRMTMERDGKDIEFPLVRERIPIKTVKGWRRTGPRDDEWEWFVDRESRIGYVRVTNFQNDTTSDLRKAVDFMKKDGMQALILDLRFNPGGLLTEAVSMANMFIDSGTIVYTEAAGGVRGSTEKAEPGRQRVRDVPVVVLVNEGSASASEIVAGAIKYYADEGKIRARLIGQRTYGKGSVQNVMPLGAASVLKLTQQYYFLPNQTCIHRREHATTWGVDPHQFVEMLPQQTNDALTLRQEADSPQHWMDAAGASGEAGKPAPDPTRLIADGMDLQLETALLYLRTQTAAKQQASATK